MSEVIVKSALTDQEVVTASKMLDVVLNEYYKVLKQKVDGAEISPQLGAGG